MSGAKIMIFLFLALIGAIVVVGFLGNLIFGSWTFGWGGYSGGSTIIVEDDCDVYISDDDGDY